MAAERPKYTDEALTLVDNFAESIDQELVKNNDVWRMVFRNKLTAVMLYLEVAAEEGEDTAAILDSLEDVVARDYSIPGDISEEQKEELVFSVFQAFVKDPQ